MDINVAHTASDYLAVHYPEVRKLTHVVYPGWTFIKVGAETFKEKRLLIADSQFLQVFNFKLAMGNRRTCLSDPYSVLLSESTSKKYFGRANALGQTIYIEGDPYQVSGIIEDVERTYTLGLKMIQGRSFRSEADSGLMVLNEAALRYNGLGADLEPLDENAAKNVIGIVNDFHFKSLYEDIEPAEIHLIDANKIRMFGVQRLLVYTNGEKASAIAKISDIWKSLYPDVPFDYSFVDETYYNLYQNDRSYTKLIIACSLASTLISCFGLIGIAYLGAFRRLKEMAIRKVYGATSVTLLVLMLKSTAISVSIACIVGIPVALHFISKWLNNFAYKAGMPYSLFCLVLVVLVLVMVLSVLLQAITVAYKEPSRILKSE